MSEPFLLFVYGQLMRVRIGHRRLSLPSRTQSLGRAHVSGRIYDCGDYPGLITGPRGVVNGELLAFTDAKLWRHLDAYELCDPLRSTKSEYRRTQIDLIGSGLRVWTYEYDRPIKNRPVIGSGVWLGK